MLLALFPTTFLSPSTGSFIYVLALLILHTFLAGLDALISVLTLPFKSLYWSMMFWIALVYGAVVGVPVFVQDILGGFRGALVELVVCMLMELHGARRLDATTTARSSSPRSQSAQSRIEATQSNAAQYHSRETPIHCTTRAKRTHLPTTLRTGATSADMHPLSPSSAHHSRSKSKPLPPSSTSSPNFTNDSKPKPQSHQSPPGLSLLLTRKLDSLLRFAASPLPTRSKSKSRSKCARKIRCRRKTELPQCLNELGLGGEPGHVDAKAGNGQFRDETIIKCKDDGSKSVRVITTTKVSQSSNYPDLSPRIDEKGSLKRREEQFRNLAVKLRRLRRLMDDDEEYY